MTKENILDYLNNLKKQFSIDPTHKSIGTWNARQMLFLNSLGGYIIKMNLTTQKG